MSPRGLPASASMRGGVLADAGRHHGDVDLGVAAWLKASIVSSMSSDEPAL
jgi:hypothetical protein